MNLRSILVDTISLIRPMRDAYAAFFPLAVAISFAPGPTRGILNNLNVIEENK
jgi:hypothetical protein